MTFSVIDYIFAALIGLFMIRCYLKGFLSEILSMAAVIFGFLVSLFLYKSAGELLKNQFWPEMKIAPYVAAFLGLFIIVYVIVKITEKMLSNIIDKINFSGADSFLGIIFGFAEGVVVVCLALFILKVQPLFDSGEVLSGSFFARLLLPLITGKVIPAQLNAEAA